MKQNMNLLDYFYPPRCPVCDKISLQGICAVCSQHVQRVREPFCMKCGKPLEEEKQEYCSDCQRRLHVYIQGRSVFSYQGPIRLSIYWLKYRNKREYARVYGREMARLLGNWVRQRQITMIVPIPLHPRRQRQRGYNQAALLARTLGAELGLPVNEALLFRRKHTRVQKMLSGGERRQNLKNAFYVQNPPAEPVRILLIDDIYTTGSTMDEAASCLMQNMDASVYVATIAIGG